MEVLVLKGWWIKKMNSCKSEEYVSGFIALLGAPNAGKSSLLNRLVGEKVSIVSHKPQTTRYRVSGICTREKAQMVFVDTPGFLPPANKGRLSSEMERSLVEAGKSVDVRVLVCDVQRMERDNQYLVGLVKRWAEYEILAPQIIVLNKIDLIEKEVLLKLLSLTYDVYRSNWNDDRVEILPVSARKKIGLKEFEKCICNCLPQGEQLYPDDIICDRGDSFMTSECIREKVFLRLHKELPYCTDVRIEKIEMQPEIVRINALIVVERESQKGIVVGKNGQTIKSIGIAARKDLEMYFDKQVMLELFVKVEPDWSQQVQVANGLCE